MNKFKWILFGMVITAIPAAVAATITFSDVNESDWFYESIQNLQEIGVVEGYEGNIFLPHNDVSRAETVVMLDRLKEYIADSCVYDNEFYLPGEEFDVGSGTSGITHYECMEGEAVPLWEADPE